jgi:hypothetical protein
MQSESKAADKSVRPTPSGPFVGLPNFGCSYWHCIRGRELKLYLSVPILLAGGANREHQAVGALDLK